ncbi:MAG: hypothetical protein JWN98_2554, partial [Abditibacteriota bacterium]|nr:hypothetical protein [Abditibacteriota bacterium]
MNPQDNELNLNELDPAYEAPEAASSQENPTEDTFTPNRRDFLKSIAAAGAGAIILPQALQAAPKPVSKPGVKP